MSGPLERFLLDRGETVVRSTPALMSGARQGVRERGKSDPIDALAFARAALREGIDTLPTARLAGPELEIRQLVLHRQRLIGESTRLTCELRWQLHDLWPEWEETPPRSLDRLIWQQRIIGRLQRAEPSVRGRIARDEIRRIKDPTRTITQIADELDALVHQAAPQLLAERGLGVITAARPIGEIAGIQRFASDAQLARIGACAPIPVSSGRTDRHRLDPGGNRQLKHAFYLLAISKIQHDPDTAVYIARPARPRQDPARSDPLSQTPPRPPRLPPAHRPGPLAPPGRS